MQIEFINYTKDLSCDEQSVFYFEDSTEALAWYDDYIDQYPDDETGCTYFSAYGVELPACVNVIKEMEALELVHTPLEMEAAAQLINYGYDKDFTGALETLNDRGYIISGHGKLDAFENFLDDICFFDGNFISTKFCNLFKIIVGRHHRLRATNHTVGCIVKRHLVIIFFNVYK